MPKSNFDFGVFATARDKYRSDYDRLYEIREKKRKEAKRDFLGVRYDQEIKSINSEFVSQLNDLKNSISDQIIRAIDAEKSRINIHLQKTAPSDLLTLERLANLSISRAEFQGLIDRFGGRDYWCDRLLTQIQERNDIVGDFGIVPPADVQLGILDECVGELDDLFASWTGAPNEKSMHALGCLSDRKINAWQDSYGQYIGKLSSSERADRALSRLLAIGDMVDRGLALRQTLANFEADPEAAEILKYKISQKPSFTDVACRYGGLKTYSDIMDYRAGRKPAPGIDESAKSTEPELSPAEQETATILSEMYASQQ